MFEYAGIPATRKGRATRSRILRAAEREFGEKGYYGGSIDGIAARAGTGAGTVYLYFRGKDDVFRALMGEIGDRVRYVLRTANRRARDRRGARRHCLKAYFAYMSRHRGVRRIVQECEFLQLRAFREYRETLADVAPAIGSVLHWARRL